MMTEIEFLVILNEGDSPPKDSLNSIRE